MACEGTVTAPDSPLEVVRVPMFSDNYGWILRDTASGVVAVVDPGEAGPIQRVLKSRFASRYSPPLSVPLYWGEIAVF
jgi:hypothetical protein